MPSLGRSESSGTSKSGAISRVKAILPRTRSVVNVRCCGMPLSETRIGNTVTPTPLSAAPKLPRISVFAPSDLARAIASFMSNSSFGERCWASNAAFSRNRSTTPNSWSDLARAVENWSASEDPNGSQGYSGVDISSTSTPFLSKSLSLSASWCAIASIPLATLDGVCECATDSGARTSMATIAPSVNRPRFSV